MVLEKEQWGGSVHWVKFLWKSAKPVLGSYRALDKVLSSRFKGLSTVEIEFLGVGSVEGTIQRKRELWNWVTRGETSSDLRGAPIETWWVSSLTPWWIWPLSSEVAAIQLCRDSVTVPDGDLRAHSEPKPVSWGGGGAGEGEDCSMEGTLRMIHVWNVCACTLRCTWTY